MSRVLTQSEEIDYVLMTMAGLVMEMGAQALRSQMKPLWMERVIRPLLRVNYQLREYIKNRRKAFLSHYLGP